MEDKSKFKIILALTLCFSVLVFFGFRVSAQTAGELRVKIEESNNEIVDLEEEIKEYQRQIDEIGGEVNTLQGAIRQIEIIRKKLATDIKISENKINSTSLTIQRLELGIGDKTQIIGKNLDGLGESMRSMDRFESQPILLILLSNEKISDAWRELENIQSFQYKVRLKVSELKGNRRELKKDKVDTQAEKNKLLALKGQMSDQKKIVDENKREQDRLLSQTKNKESNYKKLLQERLERKEALEKEIEEFELQIKYILDPSILPGPGSLSWPLDSVLITQRFGKTVDSKRLYASGTHSGVDFRAAPGTNVLAMGSGVVLDSGDTDPTCFGASWGKWILIEYDNGLASTYGHLSLVKAKKGQRVSRGEVVAYSGNTGYSTAPHLHVTVYAPDAVSVEQKPSKACGGKIYTTPLAARNAYLNPLEYLPPTTPDMFKHLAVVYNLLRLSYK